MLQSESMIMYAYTDKKDLNLNVNIFNFILATLVMSNMQIFSALSPSNDEPPRCYLYIKRLRRSRGWHFTAVRAATAVKILTKKL